MSDGSNGCGRGVLESEKASEKAPDFVQSADEELIGKVLSSDDRNSFELIIERYKRPVTKLAYRMTGDYEGSLEVAQETFIKAWRYLKSYRKEMRFSAWLFKIASNVARDFISRRRKSLDCEESLEESHAAITQPPWEQSLEGGIYVQYLLEKLREPYKTAIILRFMEDLTYDDIAHVMETTVENVKNYLFRGRKYLLDLAREAQ